MKQFLLIMIAVHALIHIMGFVREWNLAPVSQFSGSAYISAGTPAAHVAGILWLVVCILFLGAGSTYLFNRGWWWMPAIIAVAVSQVLIVLYWKDARWGTVANVIILAAAIAGYANWNFTKTVRREVSQIFAANAYDQDTKNAVVTTQMIQGLPRPVQRWLIRSGTLGKPSIQAIRLKQEGLMRTKPGQDKWVRTTAEQYITTREPAFVWKVKMDMMPLVSLTGRDKFVHGSGRMEIKALSVVPVTTGSGSKIDQGALQRYLSEICWYPSAALSPYITWEAIDFSSAKATMTYHGISGSVIFYFSDQGDVIRCAAQRYMGGGNNAKKEEWEVLLSQHSFVNGIRIPMHAEITWKLKTGDFTWYKLQITGLDYGKPILYE